MFMKNEDIMDPGITDTAEAAPEQCKDKAYGKVILYVKDRIKAGDIKVGDKLPTERELSEMLNLSRNSVREALRTLDNMGTHILQAGLRKLSYGRLARELWRSP